jgi:hypothetical protein
VRAISIKGTSLEPKLFASDTNLPRRHLDKNDVCKQDAAKPLPSPRKRLNSAEEEPTVSQQSFLSDRRKSHQDEQIEQANSLLNI